jgi:hypothetical protein
MQTHYDVLKGLSLGLIVSACKKKLNADLIVLEFLYDFVPDQHVSYMGFCVRLCFNGHPRKAHRYRVICRDGDLAVLWHCQSVLKLILDDDILRPHRNTETSRRGL